MTIDERLDRLTERHEALTQSVELMTIENRERFGEIGKAINQLVGAIDSLTRIAESHERRIENLEA